jgi:hypothetical protein
MLETLHLQECSATTHERADDDTTEELKN